ncbi:MAG: GNAT family N-acetyltransferase, partial [Anaerolineaceae bacterium]
MTQPYPTIQPMQKEDLPACVQVLTQNELWKQYGVTMEGAEQMLTHALSEGASILVAKMDGQTAGFAWYSLNGAFQRSAYLRLIGVLPEWQGHRVG